MKLIITIDTEEDNWDRYSATDNPISNIERVPDLQNLFDEFGVLPTYLVTYPVATNPRSVAILKKILMDGTCEIGMHCHPWNTPPFNGSRQIQPRDTMLSNLSEDLVHQKLSKHHDAICKNFGIVPVSFRAGRWGYGPAVGRSLCRLGYRFDTSATPYVNWGIYNGPNFTEFGPEIKRFEFDGISNELKNCELFEIPPTIGFLQANFRRSQKLSEMMETKIARSLHLNGILDRIGLLNKRWLSPEMTDVDSMIRLARRMQKNNYSFLNMFFHSTSLKGGLSGFVKSNEDKVFFKKIRDFLSFHRESGWEAMTLSQFGEIFLVNEGRLLRKDN